MNANQPITTAEQTAELIREAKKATTCLFLSVDESIARDVQGKVVAAIAALESALAAEKEAWEAERETADLCENCDGDTDVSTEESGFATVAFCIKCWNDLMGKLATSEAARQEAEQQRFEALGRKHGKRLAEITSAAIKESTDRSYEEGYEAGRAEEREAILRMGPI